MRILVLAGGVRGVRLAFDGKNETVKAGRQQGRSSRRFASRRERVKQPFCFLHLTHSQQQSRQIDLLRSRRRLAPGGILSERAEHITRAIGRQRFGQCPVFLFA